MSIILASASPRRRELIRIITKDFTAVSADADEGLPDGIGAKSAVEKLAVRKAEAVYRSHGEDTVIGCDTVVEKDGEILGKPRDEADARRMLSKLSGAVHTVHTGVCIIDKAEKTVFSQSTRVTFASLSEAEIDEYIKSGEPFDKAGGYGIQGLGARYIEKIDGDYFTVVGLPVAGLYQALRKLGLLPS